MINTQTKQCYHPTTMSGQNYDANACDISEEQLTMEELPTSALTQKTSNSPSLVSHGFFTTKIDTDRTEQSLLQLEQIPLEKFVQPFVVAQNSNNALIRMKDGSLLILKNTKAKQIHNSLLSRANTMELTTASSSNNTLTVYMGKGHAFLGLDCTSCDNGNPYHETFGLYPSPIAEIGVILSERYLGLPHATNPDFQSAFSITDEQALAVLNKKESDTNNPKYNLLTLNCIDFAQSYAPIIGESHFMDFLPEIQLHLNPNDFMNSVAHQFSILKYKVGANQDNLLAGASATSFVISYVTIKTFAQLSRFFRKTETPSKPSLTIKMQTSALIQAGSVLAARVAIGSEYPKVMQVVRLAAIAIPFTTVANEIQSQEPLNKNKNPSLSNKRISFGLGWSVATVALQIAIKSTEVIVGEQHCPQAKTAAYATYAIGGALLAFNTLRNFYHDITEAPCLDGVDLS